jgi:uroporphyrinogen III methyltransferase / synthase
VTHDRFTVVLTGTRQEGLARLLEAEGFTVVACPLVRIEPLEGAPVRAAGYDWLVLTSRNAVELLLERLEGPLPAVAAIGPGTAEALRAHGVEPALVARVSSQEGLVEELRGRAGRTLFAGAEDARDVVERELGADFVALYRTVPVEPAAFPEGDLVVLASASAARAFARLGVDRPCVSIGPATSAAARRHGLVLAAEAASHDREGLAGAVKLAASRSPSSRS